MSKYFIKNLKKDIYIYIYIYICFDGKNSFVNLRFKHNNSEHLFVKFVSGNNKIDKAINYFYIIYIYILLLLLLLFILL